ncbi:hypothetical protein BpHYR1_047041 [Brachionus plicatilis]|uniref:Uncharacterized protein n=1 Tax=Brachionus plicatilis TaxID=10195 RepID=A0A3M7PIB5_BRAPC|nr:hypothetical protein BpHYR1_047041 [Brachionus plicatilis]
MNFRGPPERFRSETEPVYSCRLLVEETHLGYTPNNLRPSEELRKDEKAIAFLQPKSKDNF